MSERWAGIVRYFRRMPVTDRRPPPAPRRYRTSYVDSPYRRGPGR